MTREQNTDVRIPQAEPLTDAELRTIEGGGTLLDQVVKVASAVYQILKTPIGPTV
jgi:hypothetical protein